MNRSVSILCITVALAFKGFAFSEERESLLFQTKENALWLREGVSFGSFDNFQDGRALGPKFGLDVRFLKKFDFSIDYGALASQDYVVLNGKIVDAMPKLHVSTYSFLAGPTFDFNIVEFGVQTGIVYSEGMVLGDILDATDAQLTYDTKRLSRFEIPLSLSVYCVVFQVFGCGVQVAYFTDFVSLRFAMTGNIRLGYKW